MSIITCDTKFRRRDLPEIAKRELGDIITKSTLNVKAT